MDVLGQGRRLILLCCVFTFGCKQDDFSFTFDSQKAPSGQIELVGLTEVQFTKSSTITLNLQSTSPYQVAFFVNEPCSYKNAKEWLTFESTKSISLPEKDGEYEIHAIYRNKDHFHSDCQSAKVILDRTAPRLSQVSLSERISTTLSTPEFDLPPAVDATSEISKYEARILSSADSEVLGWTPVSPGLAQTLTAALASGSAFYIEARAYDKAGNVSPVVRTESFYAGLSMDFGYLIENDENQFVSCVTTSCRLPSGVFKMEARLNFSLPEDITFQYSTEDFTSFDKIDYFAAQGTAVVTTGTSKAGFLLNVRDSFEPGHERKFRVNGKVSLAKNPVQIEIKNRNFDSAQAIAANQPSFLDFQIINYDQTCGLTSTGEIYCWGRQPDDSFSSVGKLRSAPGLTFTKIATRGNLLCALSSTKEIYCSNVSYVTNATLDDMDLAVSHPNFHKLASFSDIKDFAISGLSSSYLCAVLENGTIRCAGGTPGNEYWGNGGVAAGTSSLVTSFSNPGTDLVATEIAASTYGFCVLTDNQEVYCWGTNSSEEAGSPAGVRNTPNKIPGLASARTIAGGWNNYCASVLPDGHVYCWGANTRGFLGLPDGNPESSGTPIQISGLSDIQSLWIYQTWGCGFNSAGQTYCWGNNEKGALGPYVGYSAGAAHNSLAPDNLKNLTFYLNTFCGTTVAGQILCWGEKRLYEPAFGYSVPLPVEQGGFELDDYLQTNLSYTGGVDSYISSGGYSCGRDTEGYFTCFATSSSSAPKQRLRFHPAKLTRVTPEPALHLSVGTISEFLCYVGLDKKVSCKGDNTNGELGVGTTVSSDTYRKISSLSNVKVLKSGGRHSCVLTESNQVFCWGHNYSGQVGVSGSTTQSSPRLVSLPAGTIQSLAVSRFTGCVLFTNGKIYCWGNGLNGELGNGSMTATSVVSEIVSGGRQFKGLISNGDSNIFCALDNLDALYCWGGFNSSVLWLDAGAGSSLPFAVAPGFRFKDVSLNSTKIIAISIDNQVYSWGFLSARGDGLPTSFTNHDITNPAARLAGGVDKVVLANPGGNCAVIKINNQFQDMKCWGFYGGPLADIPYRLLTGP